MPADPLQGPCGRAARRHDRPSPLPASVPAAPQCLVCGSPVMADGLDVCWRHVASALGVTYRQLDYWVRRGYLRPEQDARTQGVPRKWPAAELQVARRMARLTSAGVTATATASLDVPEATCRGYLGRQWPLSGTTPSGSLTVP